LKTEKGEQRISGFPWHLVGSNPTSVGINIVLDEPSWCILFGFSEDFYVVDVTKVLKSGFDQFAGFSEGPRGL